MRSGYRERADFINRLIDDLVDGLDASSTTPSMPRRRPIDDLIHVSSTTSSTRFIDDLIDDLVGDQPMT